MFKRSKINEMRIDELSNTMKQVIEKMQKIEYAISISDEAKAHLSQEINRIKDELVEIGNKFHDFSNRFTEIEAKSIAQPASKTTKKTTKNKRNLRHATIIDESNEKNMKKIMPYV